MTTNADVYIFFLIFSPMSTRGFYLLLLRTCYILVLYKLYVCNSKCIIIKLGYFPITVAITYVLYRLRRIKIQIDDLLIEFNFPTGI